LIATPNEVFTKYSAYLKKTAITYTRCVPVRTVKEPKSPLDF